MKVRVMICILCTVYSCACERGENDSIPELLDSNPRVTQISVPGINDYLNIEVKYNGELISSITRPGDSISFFYTDEQLDSARRYSIFENGQYLDEQSVNFTKNNGNIICVKFKTLNFANDTVRFRFIYDSDRLVAIKSPYKVDTFLYKNGKITDILTFKLSGGGLLTEYYGELLERLTIKSYIDRPNPYYLISNRLGFPYFSCVMDYALGEGYDNNQECMSTYEKENKQMGVISGKLDYEYDNMGRIKSIFNSAKPNLKTLIKYQ